MKDEQQVPRHANSGKLSVKIGKSMLKKVIEPRFGISQTVSKPKSSSFICSSLLIYTGSASLISLSSITVKMSSVGIISYAAICMTKLKRAAAFAGIFTFINGMRMMIY